VIAGHFGLAAAVKSRVPAAPTWALMLASVWMDVLFVPLLVAGIETVQPFGHGDGKAYGTLLIHADLTHSLVGALVIAGAFGALSAIFWGRKLGAAMAAMVFSHWLLDLPMHHQDMPLLPQNAGDLPRLGFGLWSYPALSALLELALVALGTWLYWRKAVSVASPDARRAHVASIAMALSGVVTLALSVAGQ
jgi:membrane-bound metal-dependent hydrolase YbcI (DUF457 family)